MRDHGETEAVRGCAEALAKYGFCVLEHVIPDADISRVRMEIVEATEGMHSSSPVLDLPHFSEFLGAPAVAQLQLQPRLHGSAGEGGGLERRLLRGARRASKCASRAECAA